MLATRKLLTIVIPLLWWYLVVVKTGCGGYDLAREFVRNLVVTSDHLYVTM
jgi:hypothetical protein